MIKQCVIISIPCQKDAFSPEIPVLPLKILFQSQFSAWECSVSCFHLYFSHQICMIPALPSVCPMVLHSIKMKAICLLWTLPSLPQGSEELRSESSIFSSGWGVEQITKRRQWLCRKQVTKIMFSKQRREYLPKVMIFSSFWLLWGKSKKKIIKQHWELRHCKTKNRESKAAKESA